MILAPRTQELILYYYRPAPLNAEGEPSGSPEKVDRKIELVEPGAAGALLFLKHRESWRARVQEQLQVIMEAGLEPDVSDSEELFENERDQLLDMIFRNFAVFLDGKGLIPMEELLYIPVSARLAVQQAIENWLELENWLSVPFRILEEARERFRQGLRVMSPETLEAVQAATRKAAGESLSPIG